MGKPNISQMTTHPQFGKHLFSYCFIMGRFHVPEMLRNRYDVHEQTVHFSFFFYVEREKIDGKKEISFRF